MTSATPPHDASDAAGSPLDVLARLAANAWRRFADSRGLQVAFLVVFLGAWAAHVVRTYANAEIGGLFRWIGVDFGFYLEQIAELVHGSVDRLYSIDAEAPYRAALAAWSSTPDIPLPIGPVPYPPVYAWLLQPLDALSPPLAFAVWSLANAGAALVLAWRASTFFPPERRLLAAILVLVPTAVVLSIWFGQVQLLLAVAFGEAFVGFTRDRDRIGGVWLALLVFKPQYLLLIIPMLLWKRRWDAVAGFAIGSLAIVGLSALTVGPSSVIDWAGSLVESATAVGGALITAVAPEAMVNWRSLVGVVPLDLSATARFAITIVLSAVTVAGVFYAWRGRWEPQAERFAGLMTLLVGGTLLASYHSHIHGVSMIAVPLAAFLAAGPGRDRASRLLGVAIRADVALAVVLPWLWFAVLNRGHVTANRMVAVALVVGFVLLLALLERGRRPAVEAEPAAVPATA